jgi:site-specific recombinase XerD
VQWLESQGVTRPDEISARYVRVYLASLNNSQQTIANNARAIRVLVRFLCAEKYLPQPITFDIPKIDRKRLPSLDADNLARVLEVCDVREKAYS